MVVCEAKLTREPYGETPVCDQSRGYLVVSTMEYPDLSEYPDSNKLGAFATAAIGQKVGLRALYMKDKNVNYYEGEDGKEIDRVKRSRRKA
jgi:hypothetical protein